MNITSFKKIIPFLVVVIILLVISIFNTIIVKRANESGEEKYQNLLHKNLLSGDIENIDYDYLVNDLDDVDAILKDILNTDIDIKKKSEYYKDAQSIYDNKLNELTAVLNHVLDDEDFENLQLDLEDFYKNLDFASSEIKNTIKSTIDATYNIYKYLYEEKQRKCREVLEEYKGFLNNK